MEIPKHRVEVEYMRKVGNRFMSRISMRKVIIPYGKAQEVKTGKEAFDTAKKLASRTCNDASRVYVWMMNGNNGTGTEIKQSDDFFDKGYDDKGVM
jgi:hypothetical protein